MSTNGHTGYGLTRRGFLKMSGGVLASAYALGLAGCGGQSQGGSAGNEVTIVGLFPLTGSYASYGDWFVNGSKMAAEDINSEGGIGGKTRINAKFEDTKGLADQAVPIFQRYAGQGVPYIMSSLSSQTLALVPIAQRQKIVLMNGGAQSDALGGASPYLYNDIPLIENEAIVLTEYLVKEKGFETAAILHTDDDGGRSAAQDLKQGFNAAGGKVIATASGPFGGTNFRSQLTKLKASKADVLLLGAFGQDSKNMIDQVREIGWDVQIANTSWVAIPEVLDDTEAEGLIHTSIAFNPGESFKKEYQKKYGGELSYYVGNYYDAITIFATAYKRAQQKGYGTNGEAIKKSIDEIKTFDSIYGDKLTFAENNVASRPLDVSVIKGGESVVVAKKYGAGQ
jgi:branched-chain amino acid transport system substrate-binding protein